MTVLLFSACLLQPLCRADIWLLEMCGVVHTHTHNHLYAHDKWKPKSCLKQWEILCFLPQFKTAQLFQNFIIMADTKFPDTATKPDTNLQQIHIHYLCQFLSIIWMK